MREHLLIEPPRAVGNRRRHNTDRETSAGGPAASCCRQRHDLRRAIYRRPGIRSACRFRPIRGNRALATRTPLLPIGVRFAMNVIPFSGIAFLWFNRVLRIVSAATKIGSLRRCSSAADCCLSRRSLSPGPFSRDCWIPLANDATLPTHGETYAIGQGGRLFGADEHLRREDGGRVHHRDLHDRSADSGFPTLDGFRRLCIRVADVADDHQFRPG